MKERDFQRKLLHALKTHYALKGAVIYKHTDIMAGGIPDFSISIGYRTLWFECKIYPNVPTKLQAYFLNKHGDAAAVITCSKDGSEMYISPVNQWMAFEELVAEIVCRFIV